MMRTRPNPVSDIEMSGVFLDVPPRVVDRTSVPLDTTILHFVPASHDFSVFPRYPRVNRLSLNNLSFDTAVRESMTSVVNNLKSVEYLTIWNCKRFSSDLLNLFEGVRYLQLTHAAAQIADWSGLHCLRALQGLFLIDAHKCSDLGFIENVAAPLQTFTMHGARRLTALSGIESQRETLTHLTVTYHRDGELPRTRPALDVSAVRKLRRLQRLELVGFDFESDTLNQKARASAKMVIR